MKRKELENNTFNNLFKKWQFTRRMERGLGVVFISLICLCIFKLVWDPSWPLLVIGFGAFLLLGFLGTRQWTKNKAMTATQFSQKLNARYQNLEYSTQLLLQSDQELGILGRWQKVKTAQELERLAPDFKVPHRLEWLFGLLLLASGIFYFILANNWSLVPNQDPDRREKAGLLSDISQINKKSLPPELAEVEVKISAPPYTGIAPRLQNGLAIKAIAQSQVSWRLKLKGDIQKAVWINHQKDTFQLKPTGDNWFSLSLQIKEKGYYQLQFISKDGITKNSDFYALDIVKDQKPKLKILGLPDYSELVYHPDMRLNFQTLIQDDFGVSGARIIATVSRGEGESVKFREETITFAESFQNKSRSYKLEKSVLLNSLKMEPGDELYFYVEAWDNHQPIKQRGRTEMFFVAIEDTTQESASMELGPGLKVLPEYFRSQRQLIIDTEKLIQERAGISQDEFNQRSNDLGIDQKILRLRYGKFLGEEFERSAGGHQHQGGHTGHQHQVALGEQDSIVRFGKSITLKWQAEHKAQHDHAGEEHYEGDGHGEDDLGHRKWKEKRSSLRVLQRNEKDHSHDEARGTAPQLNVIYQGVPEEVLHLHDVMEEATFLDESLKVQLKAALANMWDSELRLRSLDPKASLPFQYKALKILKEIQQSSRVYVERIGFEPPPLQEKGKRLAGELDDIRNGYQSRKPRLEGKYPFLRKALSTLELYEANQKMPDENLRATLREASLEMTQIALEKPGQFLKALNLIKKINENGLNRPQIGEAIPILIESIYQALPPAPPRAGQVEQNNQDLFHLYRQKMGS